MTRPALALASGASFYGGLYHSAGQAPDSLTLTLILCAALLGLAGVLMRRRA